MKTVAGRRSDFRACTVPDKHKSWYTNLPPYTSPGLQQSGDYACGSLGEESVFV